MVRVVESVVNESTQHPTGFVNNTNRRRKKYCTEWILDTLWLSMMYLLFPAYSKDRGIFSQHSRPQCMLAAKFKLLILLNNWKKSQIKD